MVAFQENEVKEAWEDILQDKYRLAIQEIADCYPEKRSVHIDYTDLDLYNTNFAMFLLENPDLCLNIGRSVVNFMASEIAIGTTGTTCPSIVVLECG